MTCQGTLKETLRVQTRLLEELHRAERETDKWFPHQNKGQFCALVRNSLEAAEAILGPHDPVMAGAWTMFDQYAGIYKRGG